MCKSADSRARSTLDEPELYKLPHPPIRSLMHHIERMSTSFRIIVTMCWVVFYALVLFDQTFATSDVNVTKLEGIGYQLLNALPEIQCQQKDVPTGRPVESCVFKSDLKKVFIIGFNTTTCYLCYVNSSYSKVNLTDVQNVNWYASLGK